MFKSRMHLIWAGSIAGLLLLALILSSANIDRRTATVQPQSAGASVTPNAELLHHRGLMWAVTPHHGNALADLERAVELEPENARYWYSLGMIYAEARQTENAVAALSQALEIDPEADTVYINRGLLYNVLGDMDAALADFEEADARGLVDFRINVIRGEYYTRIGDFDAALEQYAIAYNPDPTNNPITARILRRAASLYLLNGQPAEAEQYIAAVMNDAYLSRYYPRQADNLVLAAATLMQGDLGGTWDALTSLYTQ